jgi:hypothetical protein
MSLKEFSVRCSAITLVTANAFGIVQAIGPRLPRTMRRLAARPAQNTSARRLGLAPIRAPQRA